MAFYINKSHLFLDLYQIPSSLVGLIHPNTSLGITKALENLKGDTIKTTQKNPFFLVPNSEFSDLIVRPLSCVKIKGGFNM
uniref:Uncharacterized protein n=1 Tax=Salix viminalis TaxID=40686 RepID=A0A6N2KLQ6_SALVM